MHGGGYGDGGGGVCVRVNDKYTWVFDVLKSGLTYTNISVNIIRLTQP